MPQRPAPPQPSHAVLVDRGLGGSFTLRWAPHLEGVNQDVKALDFEVFWTVPGEETAETWMAGWRAGLVFLEVFAGFFKVVWEVFGEHAGKISGLGGDSWEKCRVDRSELILWYFLVGKMVAKSNIGGVLMKQIMVNCRLGVFFFTRKNTTGKLWEWFFEEKIMERSWKK